MDTITLLLVITGAATTATGFMRLLGWLEK